MSSSLKGGNNPTMIVVQRPQPQNVGTLSIIKGDYLPEHWKQPFNLPGRKTTTTAPITVNHI